MHIILKYVFAIIIVLSIGLYYLLYTSFGNAHIYDYISYKMSKKSELDIKITSINARDYPNILLEMLIEEKAKLLLKGTIDTHSYDMDYTMNSNCIVSEACTIDDDLDIQGHIKGDYTSVLITGNGKALDGNVSYTALKFPDKVEDLVLSMRGVSSDKFFTLLGQDTLIKGKADIHLSFKHMDAKSKQGSFTYRVEDNNFLGIPLTLQTTVAINNMQHVFDMDIYSPYLTLNIFDGNYTQNKKIAKASYTLDIKDLAPLKTLLGYEYAGELKASGSIKYNKHLRITGISHTYDGSLEYLFEEDGLKVKLAGVSLRKLMGIFPYPAMLDASASGHIYYNFLRKTMVANTQLKNTKFIHSKLVDTVYQKSHVDMLKETFDNSKLDVVYHDNLLIGELKLLGDNNHLYLTKTKINTKENTIQTHFNFNMQKQVFSGSMHGSLQDPKVNLDMQRLVKHNLNRKIDALIGKRNRKRMDKIPMSGMVKNMLSGAGAKMIKLFF